MLRNSRHIFGFAIARPFTHLRRAYDDDAPNRPFGQPDPLTFPCDRTSPRVGY